MERRLELEHIAVIDYTEIGQQPTSDDDMSDDESDDVSLSSLLFQSGHLCVAWTRLKFRSRYA